MPDPATFGRIAILMHSTMGGQYYLFTALSAIHRLDVDLQRPGWQEERLSIQRCCCCCCCLSLVRESARVTAQFQFVTVGTGFGLCVLLLLLRGCGCRHHSC